MRLNYSRQQLSEFPEKLRKELDEDAKASELDLSSNCLSSLPEAQPLHIIDLIFFNTTFITDQQSTESRADQFS